VSVAPRSSRTGPRHLLGALPSGWPLFHASATALTASGRTLAATAAIWSRPHAGPRGICLYKRTHGPGVSRSLRERRQCLCREVGSGQRNRCDQDQGHGIRPLGRDQLGDRGADAVTHDHCRPGQQIGDLPDLFGVTVQGERAFGVSAVTHAGEVQRHELRVRVLRDAMTSSQMRDCPGSPGRTGRTDGPGPSAGR
jgi:hypothetical protein